MTGSLQSKHGKYYVVVRLTDTDGNKKSKWINTNIPTSGNNKRKAQSRMIEILAELDKQPELVNSDMLFTELIEVWMGIKENEVRLNTLESYRYYIDGYIKPYFDRKKLTVKSIRREDVEAFYKHLLKNGLSPNSLPKFRVVINGALQEACNRHLIAQNPARDIRLPKMKHFEGKAYSVEQASALLKAIEGEQIKPAVVLGLYYGLRRSEVCGLRWKDIDFDSGTMLISNTVVRTKTLIEHEQTKSQASKRTLVLIPDTVPYLKALKAEQDKNRAKMGSKYPDSIGHVCVKKNGQPFPPDYVSRAFRQLLERNDLPSIRFHELRHTAGSILLEKGMSIKHIQNYLGHEKAATTLDIYSHLSLEGKAEAAFAMNDVFKSA